MGPLIDCVFLLLIFFLVSTMVKKENRDIDIELPESESAEALKPSDELVVLGVDADGNIFLDGIESTIQEIHTELREIALDDPDFPVRLDADEEAPTGRVIELFDLCQFNNLNDVAIRTYDEHYNRR